MSTVTETTLVENGYLSDRFMSNPSSMTESDNGYFADVYTQRALSLVSIIGTFTDAHTGQQTTSIPLYDVGRFTDSYSASPRLVFADTGAFTDVYTGKVPGDLLMSGHFSDAYTRALTTHSSWSDAGGFTDSYSDSNTLAQVSVTGTFDTALTQAVRNGAALGITGTFGTVLSGFRTLVDQLLEAGAVDDAFSQRVSARAPVLADEMFGDGFPVSVPTGAWTTSSDSWAMTRHEYTSADSMASLDNDLFVATISGIERFVALGDVDAWVTSRIIDFDSDFLKAPVDMYVGYTSEQPLTVTMISMQDGVSEVSYDYTMPERAAATWVPARVKLGRGMRSRYFRYQLANTDGGDFSLDNVKFLMDVMTRQV